MTELLRCLTIHAERLERDEVWRRTTSVLRALETRGGRATLFVHPFTAIEAGVDLGSRIGELLARGHEVGQHTHFYAPRPAGSSGKPKKLLIGENIRRCLDRDLAFLRRAGADPRGFVSGGWVIHDEVLHWLREQGFVYDASVRSFRLSYENPDAVGGDGWTVPRLDSDLLRIPTTSPVTDVARRKGVPVQVGELRFELTYVHDYDLISLPRRLAATTVLRRWGEGPWATTAELAGRIQDELARG